MRARLFAIVGLLLCVAVAGPALAGEPDINGLWQGSLYGSDVQAKVEQEDGKVQVEAVVHDLAGGTNVYHFIGFIEKGHMVLIHGSGHRFEGDARDGMIIGTLFTKGGSKIEVRAQRASVQPNGQGSMGQDTVKNAHRPG